MPTVGEAKKLREAIIAEWKQPGDDPAFCNVADLRPFGSVLEAMHELITKLLLGARVSDAIEGKRYVVFVIFTTAQAEQWANTAPVDYEVFASRYWTPGKYDVVMRVIITDESEGA